MKIFIEKIFLVPGLVHGAEICNPMGRVQKLQSLMANKAENFWINFTFIFNSRKAYGSHRPGFEDIVTGSERVPSFS